MGGARGVRLDTLQARRILGGLTIAGLARASNTSDRLIIELENGGSCEREVAQRILDALAPPVAITSNTQASPTVITCATHTFQTGDTVTLAGIVGSDADANGARVATRVNATSFSVPVNCGVAGGTGGTATIVGASAGLVSLDR